jgi:hypothetical protein
MRKVLVDALGGRRKLDQGLPKAKRWRAPTSGPRKFPHALTHQH